MVVQGHRSAARIVLIDNNATRSQRVAKILRDFPEAGSLCCSADLCEGFNTIEHHPPSLVLVCEKLSQLPEFEALQTLCRCLGVRCATFSLSFGHKLRAQGVDFAAEETQIFQQLSSLLSAPASRSLRATAGLLRAPQKVHEEKIAIIGSSTGGLEALLVILGSFPEKCPPTVIVQHTSAGFSDGFARLLNNRVGPLVKIATEGETLERGKVLIAPSADTHLYLEGRSSVSCRLRKGERVSGHLPSIDTFFSSAVPLAKRIVATILTGMGRDGATGLLKLRQAGAITMAQDEMTSVVYGMPKVAAELNAVDSVLPLNRIGPAILKAMHDRGTP